MEVRTERNLPMALGNGENGKGSMGATPVFLICPQAAGSLLQPPAAPTPVKEEKSNQETNRSNWLYSAVCESGRLPSNTHI